MTDHSTIDPAARDAQISRTVSAEPVEPEIVLSVLLFASLKDVAQADRISVRMPVRDGAAGNGAAGKGAAGDGAAPTVADFLRQCAQQHPALSRWLPHIHVAVNCEYAAPEQALHSGDEIALLPPVSGGCEPADE